MYKIIKPNDTFYRPGDLVKDSDLDLELRRIQAEGGILPVISHRPDFGYEIYNLNTGELFIRRPPYSKASYAYKSASEHLSRILYEGFTPHSGYRIIVTQDGDPYIGVDVRYL